MTIVIAIAVLTASGVAAVLYDRGLPGTMRRVALWLVVEARKIDQRRAARDARIRQALAAEGGAL